MTKQSQSRAPVRAPGSHPRTAVGASAHIRALTRTRDEQQNEQRTLHARLTEVTDELVTALRAEDYLQADKVKATRTTLEASLEALRSGVAGTEAELRSARTRFQTLYLEENPPLRDDFVPVYRVVVVDPLTGDQDSAVFLEDAQDIMLTVGTTQFNAEAGHVQRWAERKGFICIRSEARATF